MTQGVETGMATGIHSFGAASWTLAFGPGQYFKLGSMGEKTDISATERTIARRFGSQVTRTPSTTKLFLEPTPKTTTVFGPKVDGQANREEYETFEGSKVELHRLIR
jgi:hypothetical protein